MDQLQPIKTRFTSIVVNSPAIFKWRWRPQDVAILERQYCSFDQNPFCLSLLGMVIGIDTASHHFNAPATLICGHSSSIWSMENGVPFRGALGEIPIHRTQSLARARVLETLLENAAMIWAHRCFLHACRARLILYVACVEGLRTHA